MPSMEGALGISAMWVSSQLRLLSLICGGLEWDHIRPEVDRSGTEIGRGEICPVLVFHGSTT